MCVVKQKMSKSKTIYDLSSGGLLYNSVSRAGRGLDSAIREATSKT
jgi:hypothetical protein